MKRIIITTNPNKGIRFSQKYNKKIQVIAKCAMEKQFSGVKSWDTYLDEKLHREIDKAVEKFENRIDKFFDNFEFKLIWNAIRHYFHKFSTRVILGNCMSLEAILKRERPDEVIVVEDFFAKSWWTGQGMIFPLLKNIIENQVIKITTNTPPLLYKIHRSLFKTFVHIYFLHFFLHKILLYSRKIFISRKTESIPSKYNILILADRKTAYDMAKPVVDELNREGCTVYFLKYGPLSRTLPLQNFESFLSFQSILKTAKTSFKCFRHTIPFVFNEVFRARFETLFNYLLPANSYYFNVADSLFQRIKIDGVFLPTAGLVSNCIVSSASLRKIKSFFLPHGLLGQSFYTGVDCKRYFAYGQYQLKIYEKKVPKSKVTIVGCPLYDKLIKGEIGLWSKKESEQVVGTKGKKYILIASQFIELGWIEPLFNAIKQVGDIHLVVKAHPLEKSVRRYERLRNKTGVNLSIFRDVPIANLIKHCDLFITQHSTTAFEAMILKKPVLIINLSGKKDIYPFTQYGAAYGVYKEEDILPGIKKLLYDRKFVKKQLDQQKKFLHSHLGPLDGLSSVRVVRNILKSLAYENRSNIGS